jgi:hypothetical protein
MEEKVYFSRRGFRSRPRPGTLRLRIHNSGPYYWCIDTNGAKNGRQTDRRQNDFRRAHFSKKGCFKIQKCIVQLFNIEIQPTVSKIGLLAEKESKKEEKSDFDQITNIIFV